MMRIECVYIMENENHHVKIGITADFLKRMNTIRTTSGYKIIQSYYTDGCVNARRIEASVHKELSHCRMQGEWFDCRYEDALEVLKQAYSQYAITKTKAEMDSYNEKVAQDGNELIDSMVWGRRDVGRGHSGTRDEIAMQRRIEDFLGLRLSVGFVVDEYSEYIDVGEAAWAEGLRARYPNLTDGLFHDGEWNEYVAETYKTLKDSGLCAFAG